MDDNIRDAIDALTTLGVTVDAYCVRLEKEVEENHKYIKMVDENVKKISVSGKAELMIAMLKYGRVCKKICEQEGWLKEESTNG